MVCSMAFLDKPEQNLPQITLFSIEHSTDNPTIATARGHEDRPETWGLVS